MKSEESEPVFDWKGKKILLVEDDYVSYLYFHEILSRSNACLIRAVSLQEAFDMIASGANVNLMIINTGIPGNENCRSVKRIRLLWPGIRIIAVDGQSCSGMHQTCYPSGCDTLISNHIDCGEMVALVDDMLIRSQDA